MSNKTLLFYNHVPRVQQVTVYDKKIIQGYYMSKEKNDNIGHARIYRRNGLMKYICNKSIKIFFNLAQEEMALRLFLALNSASSSRAYFGFIPSQFNSQ